MEFEYSEVKTYTQTIDIEDIGNCCLLTRDQIGRETYLVIQSILGFTKTIQYGPIIPDLGKLPQRLSYYYDSFDYSDQKIVKMITKFCTDASHVEITNLEYIRDHIVNMVDTFEEFPDGASVAYQPYDGEEF